MSSSDEISRALQSIRLARWGRVVSADGVIPYVVVDPEGRPVEPIRRELRDWLQADIVGEAVSARLAGSHTFFRLMPEDDILALTQGLKSAGNRGVCPGDQEDEDIQGRRPKLGQRSTPEAKFACEGTVLAEVSPTHLSSIEITSLEHLTITATSQFMS
jgi:hypothetical protein